MQVADGTGKAGKPVDDGLLRQLLMAMVRFRAWALGGVYTAGAMTLVTDGDGRVLLVKPRYRRGWGLPGGFMKRGEQAADAARRELLEETGIAVKLGALHAVYVQGRRRHIDHLYLVELGGEAELEPRMRAEIQGAGWYPLDSLPPLQREADEALRKAGRR